MTPELEKTLNLLAGASLIAFGVIVGRGLLSL